MNIDGLMPPDLVKMAVMIGDFSPIEFLRSTPMLGFGAVPSAQRFCRAFEEVRQYFRPRRKQNEAISLSQARRQFLFRALELESLFLEA
jgi:hypothetical protein